MFGRYATDPVWQEVLALIAGMIHESLLAHVLDHLLDIADSPGGRIGRHAGRHVVLALRCLAEARSITGLDTQSRRLIRVLIDLIVGAHHAIAADPLARPPVLASIQAAVPLLEGLRPRLPGREAYLAMQRLREAAEKAKIELSSQNTATINLPYITIDASHSPLWLDTTLSRAEFQRITSDLVDRTRVPFNQVVKDAGISVN